MMSGAGPTIDRSSHPRAFGRTSNVWQYLDDFQDRLTPPTTLNGAIGSRLGERRHQDRREPVLNPLGDGVSENEDDTDDERAEQAPIQGQSEIKREDSIGQIKRMTSGPDRLHKSSVASSISSSRHSVNFAEEFRDHTRHGSGMKNVVSLPELLAPGRKSSSKASAQTSLSGNLSNGEQSGSTTRTPIWRRERKTIDKPSVDAAQVMKTLHALGASASAPVLPPPTSLSPLPAGLPQQQLPVSVPFSGVPSPTNAPSTSNAAASSAVVTDAEKLRNDFNSQRTRLSYGCSVALELFNGHIMMVGSPDGQVRVQSLEKFQALPQVKGYKDRAVFTLIDLGDPRSASSIRYGDAVWLQLSVGTGETTWEQGGVLGAKVREAPQLKALALSEDANFFRGEAPAPVVVGHPVPVRAYLPKSRDDGDMQMDEIQSRVRNKSSKMLGKWVVRSAVHSTRKQVDNFVYNNDEIYLEQDWFYLGADSDAGKAVLRQLPSASSCTAPDLKEGEYVVERRGAWRVRLLDSSNGGAGLSLAQQQMERLLLHAKTQLKQSRKMRAGQTRTYWAGLHGGASFTKQLRAHVLASTDQCDKMYIARQQMRLATLGGHLMNKAREMNVDVLSSPPSVVKQPVIETEEFKDAASAHQPPSNLPSPKLVDECHGSCREGCALCISSTMSLNLCSELPHVLRRLRDEFEEQQRARDASFESDEEEEYDCEGVVSNRRDSSDNSVEVSARHHAQPNERPASTLSSVGTGRTLVSRGGVSTPLSTPNDPLVIDVNQEYRLRSLMASEDAAMMEIIRFQEKEELDAAAAEEQAKIGLSPVAAHLRDRFKHVGLLAQAHHLGTHEPQHGIGGHFQRLHAELTAEAAEARIRSEQEVEGDTAQELSTGIVSEKSENDDSEEFADDLEELPKVRLFPTEDELDQLPPIDTKNILSLYSQNTNSALEMLEGFVEIVEVHVTPNLQAAMATLSRGALVEVLDFTARAAEFVCAVRVQVRVAQLLRAISASEAGDFSAFIPELEMLLEELEGTAAFVRFFRERAAQAKRKRRQ